MKSFQGSFAQGGFQAIIHPFSPIPEDISAPSNPNHQSSHSSTLDQPEIVPDAFHVDQDTIREMEENLGQIKLTLKWNPGSKNWVSYKSIQHFPEEEE